jgi:hypothetical protein
MLTGGSERLRIDTSGNVGIGTSSPVYQTQIYGSGQTTAALTDAGNKGGSLLLNTPTVAGGDGGALLIGAGGSGAKPFAAVKGLLADGGGNTTGSLAFSTRNATGDTALTERMRIDSSGNVLIGKTSATANGGVLQVSNGITFPATQSASSDANTLDDYEEGTWTPTVVGVTTAGTATYSVQLGSYTKIGNLVYVNIYLTYTGGTGTGQLRISGLPFTSAASYLPVASVYLDNIAVTAAHYPLNLMNASSTTIDFYQSAGGGASALPYDAAGTILLSLTYRV